MRKLLLLVCTILLGCPWAARGQEALVEPEARFITHVPFEQLIGGVILVKATVNNVQDSLHFILDTGSGGISLDSITAVRYKFEQTPSDRTIRGIGGIRKVKYVNHATLNLPGMQTDSLNFHVNDYELLSSVYGIKIDGIIGFSFLSRYIVRINYDSSRLEVFTRGRFKYKRGGHVFRPLLSNIPIQTVQIKDARTMKHRYYFDTGAGLCFLLSKAYTRDSNVMRKSKPKPVITQAEGLGGKTMMEFTTLKEVKLGPYKFRRVPTYVFDDVYNVTSYPSLGGLIGNDLLRRFTVTLNYGKKEIHLLPNKHYKDPFDYSYTGLGIYYHEGKIFVEDVVPGSPGEKAGLKTGDILLGIGFNFSNDIQVYKNMLQNTQDKHKLLVVRDGQAMQMVIKPRSILKKK